MSRRAPAVVTGPATGPLTAEEQHELAAARLLALEQMPYLATALFEVVVVRSPGLGTFAVDAAWRLYVDPDTLAAWGPQQAAGVLLHEVGHLLRDHHARGAEQAGPDDPPDGLLWNLAGDAEINDDLVAAGIPLPGRPVTPRWLGQPDGQLAEQYYVHLLARRRDLLDPACGSGAGGVPLEVELDDEADPPGRDALDQALVRRKVAEDVAAAADGPAAGTVPGGWRRWAQDVLAPAQVDWRRRLRRTVRRGLAVHAGQLDTSYRRPGRRRVPRVVTPALVQPALRVGVVLDTSASMDTGQLHAALAELDGLCRRAGLGPDGLLVVTADVEVHEVRSLRRAGDLPILGGGGTDLRPALAHVAGHRRRPHLLVVLTDGFTPWPGTAPAGCTVVGVLVARTDGQRPDPPPPWMETIRIGPTP